MNPGGESAPSPRPVTIITTLTIHHCQPQLSLTEPDSLSAPYLVRHFTHIILFNPLNNRTRQVALSPHYRWEN